MTDRSRVARLDEYLEFARLRPELFGPASDAGIRILLERPDIERVEDDMIRVVHAQGLPESAAHVGLICHDPYLLILRDAVEFPDGARRTYTRVLNRFGQGAAVFPLLDGRVVLTRQFRHAIRRWSLEIPRGAIEPGHTAESTAYTEVREEIGGDIAELVPIGFSHGSTHLHGNGAYLFFARLRGVGAPQLGEAITGIEQVTVAEFERLLRDGEIVDSVTLAAFAHARLRGLI